jgi:WD40 repeat protein
MLRPIVWMLGLLPAAVLAAPAFDREIAPILRSYCAGCHNDREAESGFSVERFASLRRGGDGSGDPIVAGDAEASVLIRRIRSSAADHMPPPDEPQVPADDLATLEAWIAAGAAGPATDGSILETLSVPPLPPFAGTQPVTALAVTADGTRLAVARGRSVAIVALEDGRPVGPPLVAFAEVPGRVAALHFSRDGTRLVLAAGIPGLRGVAEIRDAATGGILQSFAGHRDLLADAELAPDEATLATAGYDRSIKLWNVADGGLVRSIDGHTGAVHDLAWHPSGSLFASASADETVKLWRRRDGLRLDTLSQPQGEVTSVAFTPDGGHVFAAGRDKRIHAWRLASLDAPAIHPAVQSRFAHEAPIVAMALSADGRRLVTAAEDRSLTSWALPDLVLAADAPRQTDLVAALAPAGAGRFAVGRMDGSLDLVEAGGGEPRGAAAAADGPPASPDPAADLEVAAVAESEPNDAAAGAQPVPMAAAVAAAIQSAGDADCFRFRAAAGRPLVVEVIAASGTSPSKLDSRLEILDAEGRPVEQVVLQAVRDSWLTFLGKNSTQIDDFRLQNWEEMELDEYVYAGGEVVRLWLYPRGPDSGFMVYPGTGDRHAFFHTTPVAHPLGEPAWVVEPLPRGAAPVPNGLPVFRLAYENDDDSTRRLGTDSQLLFVPPDYGDYVARVTDVRGFGGSSDFHYTLGIRPPRPAFAVRIDGTSPQVSPGGGREVSFHVTRSEGFIGPVRIEVEGLPAGFRFHGPIEIEAGQQRARGVISAAVDAPPADEAADAAVRVRAVAEIGGREVVQELGTLGDIGLAGPPKFTVTIEPAAGTSAATPEVEPPVFRIRPGETIAARVRVERRDFTERIDFGGNDQADRNLPHGVIVDNLGLNGLLIVEGESEREFVLRAALKARPGRRPFHLLAAPDGGQASPPAVLEVLSDRPAAE